MSDELTLEEVRRLAFDAYNTATVPAFYAMTDAALMAFAKAVRGEARQPKGTAIEISLLREFSQAMEDAGDWPDTSDERERLKRLVDSVRKHLVNNHTTHQTGD